MLTKHDSIYCRDCIRLLKREPTGWYSCWKYKARLRDDRRDPIKCLECVRDRAGEYETETL
jgi:hypothetical protein